ncbi:MAG: hypothetical protein L0Z48_04725, partial [candidate division Zixibacteria bacterium]|nr:hypothetical protein [candidate division Zixibacteria bacterium]
PRTLEVDGAILVFYQPQLYKWDSFLYLESYLAFEASLASMPEPVFGSARIRAETETDFETRSVLIYNKKVEEVFVHSPDLKETGQVEEIIRSIQTSPEAISLDRLIAMVDSSDVPQVAPPFSNDPPTIYYSENPAILLIFDGDPLFAPIANTELEFTVNTNWDIFFDKTDSSFYLLAGDVWLASPDIFSGWQMAEELPQNIYSLPKEKNWERVLEHLPPRMENPPETPEVFASIAPAELVLTDGPPQFAPLPGADLLLVSNTDSDLFYSIVDGFFYYLVSGRWFSARSLAGPWRFATDNLPEGFANIPEDHKNAAVLFSVPDTPQASEAYIESQIPQIANVRRDVQMPEEVIYDGDPQFEPIEETDLEYAANTPYDVIKVDNLYYLCFSGIWFYSRSPYRGWIVCTAVPLSIYRIPPACPVYHVTHVRIYGYSETYVRFGYSAGYMGVYAYRGAAVYGTGFYYRPYYYLPPGGNPVYYPHHYSYGFSGRYHPYTGRYIRSARVYGPYGG